MHVTPSFAGSRASASPQPKHKVRLLIQLFNVLQGGIGPRRLRADMGSPHPVQPVSRTLSLARRERRDRGAIAALVSGLALAIIALPRFQNLSFCDSRRGRSSSRWHPSGHPIAGLYLPKARAWHRAPCRNPPSLRTSSAPLLDCSDRVPRAPDLPQDPRAAFPL